MSGPESAYRLRSRRRRFHRWIVAALLLLPSLARATLPSETKVYWLEAREGYIERANADGSNAERIVYDPGVGRGISIDAVNQVLSWPSTFGVLHSDLDGRGVTLTPIPQNDSTGWFVVHSVTDPSEGTVYFSTTGLDQLRRVEPDGSGLQEVLPYFLTGPGPWSVDFDPVDRWIYYAFNAHPIQGIRRIRPDGSQEQFLTRDPDAALQEIALDVVDRRVYWIDNYRPAFLFGEVDPRIMRSRLDGSDVETIADVDDGLIFPIGLAVDPIDGHVFWSDRSRGTITRANLDGSNQVDILTGLDFPVSVAVMPLPEPGTPALLATGALWVLWLARRRKHRG
ncbi:MAG: PEP-CTERM sorting domain-containing protein [Myxococcota bacterium]